MHMHIDATDLSVAMHRVVRILFFVSCLVPVSVQLASIWPLAENCSQLKVIHSMRRGAGSGKPDGPKRLPIALGFKCVNCRKEFDSRHAINGHCRHSLSVGTPCADPQVHVNDRQAAGILRQHATLGVFPIPDVCFSQLMLTSDSENAHINLKCNNRYNCYNRHNPEIIAIIGIIVNNST